MPTERFQTELQQRVRLSAVTEGEEASLGSAFTRLVLQLLVEAGEVSDPRETEAVFESRRMQVSAFDWDEDRGLLTLIVSAFTSGPEVSTLTKAELRPLFGRIERFGSACIEGLHREIEESTDVYDAALYIHDVWADVLSVRFVVATNALLRTSIPLSKEFEGRPARYEVWDIERLERLESSGKTQEPLNVLTESFGLVGLSALGPFGGAEYDAYLLVIPGQFLADIYEDFGPRLLELNVRSFLQARGRTNQGIQATLKNEPARFLAYNNGLSMTATSVETSIGIRGETLITRLHGLQIVNGGQTTASLYYASRKSGSSLSDVFVQSKLTVLDQDATAGLAPLVSRYANTQNLIRMADFSANDPFHVELEKLSRNIWAPASDGAHEMTRWFYERARGQYADALGREKTDAQKRQFSSSHPRTQLFVKTDVAKYDHAWGQLPHLVALGAEKNFKNFSQNHAESKLKSLPDATYFEHLVSKAIMWRQTEKIVNSLKLGGYRSAVVAFTLSLISNRTSMRVDLDQIWKEQDVSEAWKLAVTQLAPVVQAKLISSAGARNVLEWAKSSECWNAVQGIDWSPPAGLSSAGRLSASRSAVAPSGIATSLPASDEEMAGRDMIARLGAESWFDIATWAKETGNLQPWQRGLAFSIGTYLSQERLLSAKQVTQGVKIAVEARRLGCRLQ